MRPDVPYTAPCHSGISQNASQRVALPVIVNGRVDQPGDWDVFSFEGRAGQEITAEVMGRSGVNARWPPGGLANI